MIKVIAVPENQHNRRLRYLYVKLNGKAYHLSGHSGGYGRDDEGDIVFTNTKTPHHRFAYKTTRTGNEFIYSLDYIGTFVTKNNDAFLVMRIQMKKKEKKKETVAKVTRRTM